MSATILREPFLQIQFDRPSLCNTIPGPISNLNATLISMEYLTGSHARETSPMYIIRYLWQAAVSSISDQ